MSNLILNDKELNEWQEGTEFMQKNKKLLYKIHQQQKKKTLTYMQSIDRKKTRPFSSPSKPLNVNQSINQLRSQASTQQLKTQKIHNRLKYLHTSKQRHQKLVNTARQKFNKINEIRRQSFTQKSFFSKQKQNALYQNSKSVYFQACKIKSQKQKSVQSQLKIKMQKHSMALAVKKQRQHNQTIIKEQQMKQRLKRQQKVFKVHKQAQISRQRSQSRSKQKIEQGFLNHRQNILTQFQKVQRQLKVNTKLMQSFETRALKIYDKKIKEQEKLGKYREYLGLNKSELNVKGCASSKNVNKQQKMIVKASQKDRSYLKSASTARKDFSSYINHKQIDRVKVYTAKSPKNIKNYSNDSENSFYLTNPEKY